MSKPLPPLETLLEMELESRVAELETEVQHQVERREEEKLRAVNAEAERDALRIELEVVRRHWHHTQS